MKKDEFLKLGLDEETAKQCEAASKEELKGFISQITFQEVRAEKEQAELDVKERDEQLERLKQSQEDAQLLKQTIMTLEAENKTKDEAHETQLKSMGVDRAVEQSIRGNHGKNAKAIRALLDLSNAQLGEDGCVIGLAEQIFKLQRGEDSCFLFGPQTKMRGAISGESGRENPDAKVDTSQMTYTELSAYMASNPEAKID